jgi:hypothetical protein
MMHLQKLSKSLDAMIRSGDGLKEISDHAQSLVETELVPDYVEFRRQLEAMQARRANKILEATGKVLEIDASFWSPRFVALFLKALSSTFVATAETRKELLTNRDQAFQFMHSVEQFKERGI